MILPLIAVSHIPPKEARFLEASIWRSKLGGMELSEARRLQDLEDENRKLKRLVADLSLNKIVLEDVIKKIQAPKTTNGLYHSLKCVA